MGGQQFLHGHTLCDLRGLGRILSFEAHEGWVEVEAGIHWDELVHGLLMLQGEEPKWGIIQKQTGADRLTVGGALAANAHGRGLTLPPIVADVQEFLLVDAHGELKRCSRTENSELFGLAIGGYGLFGPIYSVKLKLARRRQLERVVNIEDSASLMQRFEERKREGFEYGDFQFSCAEDSETFLSKGVFSCYRPVENSREVDGEQKSLSEEDWRRLILLGHTDKRRAYEAYADYYVSTSGQLYWSDTHQLSTYIDDYHTEVDERLGVRCPGAEMITELYVPPERFAEFMSRVRTLGRVGGFDFIYGTVRLIEQDTETFLPWARQPFACIVLNLHFEQSPAGLAKLQEECRALIDAAADLGGSFFLTYHRFATRDQLLACHPRLPEFLSQKRAHDPNLIFRSDWFDVISMQLREEGR